MYYSSASRLMIGTLLLQMSFLSVGYNHTKTTLYHGMDTADKYMVLDLLAAISNRTLIEAAVEANAEPAVSFLFNGNTQQCVVEPENAVQFSIPHQFDRFTIHQKENLKVLQTTGLSRPAYTVNMGSRSTLVNPGDKYVAQCNISSRHETLELNGRLMVSWSHNGQPLTTLCDFPSSELTRKYYCGLIRDRNNGRFEFGVFDVQRADTGNLTCEVYERIKENDKWVKDEVVAIKSVAIQVRDQKIMALDTTTSQSPQPNVFTKEDNDEDLWNSISVPKSILENRHSDVELSYTKAKENQQSHSITTLPTNRKKSLAEELLEKTKGLLESTNVLP